MATGQTASERFQLLVKQLRDEETELRGVWGWQGRVAKRLGVTQPSVSRYLSGSRKADGKTVGKAIRRLRISPVFFYGQFAKEPHYRDFVGVQRPSRAVPYRAFQEYLETIEGKSITPMERELLEGFGWPGEPTVQSYHYLLMSIRSMLSKYEDGASDDDGDGSEDGVED